MKSHSNSVLLIGLAATTLAAAVSPFLSIITPRVRALVGNAGCEVKGRLARNLSTAGGQGPAQPAAVDFSR